MICYPKVSDELNQKQFDAAFIAVLTTYRCSSLCDDTDKMNLGPVT